MEDGEERGAGSESTGRAKPIADGQHGQRIIQIQYLLSLSTISVDKLAGKLSMLGCSPQGIRAVVQ